MSLWVSLHLLFIAIFSIQVHSVSKKLARQSAFLATLQSRTNCGGHEVRATFEIHLTGRDWYQNYPSWKSTQNVPSSLCSIHIDYINSCTIMYIFLTILLKEKMLIISSNICTYQSDFCLKSVLQSITWDISGWFWREDHWGRSIRPSHIFRIEFYQ